MPLSTMVMIDEDQIMEIVDEIRLSLPDEIKQASWTIQEQQRLITEAHSEAARIIASANERAEAAVAGTEIQRRADARAQQALREAEARAEQITRDAEAYALEQLKQLEAHLTRTMITVRRGIESLQPREGEEPA